MKESELQTKFVWLLKKRGAKVLNIHGHGFQAAGWPDILVIHWQFAGFIEFKVGKNELSKLQQRFAYEIALRKFPVYIITYRDEHIMIQKSIIFHNDVNYHYGYETFEDTVEDAVNYLIGREDE